MAFIFTESAHQVLQHLLIERRIIASGDQLPSSTLIEAPRFVEERQKSSPAILEVGGPMLRTRRAEGMDIETNVFAVFPVAISFQRADLVEGDAEVGTAERFVLVKFQPVLIVEMQRP